MEQLTDISGEHKYKTNKKVKELETKIIKLNTAMTRLSERKKRRKSVSIEDFKMFMQTADKEGDGEKKKKKKDGEKEEEEAEGMFVCMYTVFFFFFF